MSEYYACIKLKYYRIILYTVQVAGFPRHNITCPVTGLGSTAKLSAGQAEEVRRMKLGPRSAVCVAAAQQPGTDLALQRLVAGVTRAHANFVFLHNTQVS